VSGLSNKQIASVFKEIEILLKLNGESDQRAMNYGRLSRMIEGLPDSAADLAAAGQLDKVKGIGPRVQTVVAELVDRGTSTMRDDLAAQLGPGVLEILRVPGLGPKRVHAVVTELGLESLEDLADAASDGRLAKLSGFGKKTAQNVLDGIEFLNRTRGRLRINHARAMAEQLADEHGIAAPVFAGALRRCTPLVDSVVVLGVGDTDQVLLDEPRGALPAARVRLVPAAMMARALFEETGPTGHVAAVLAAAGADDSEEAIYTSRGLHFVPPERRHACDGASAVPALLEEGDIRGLVHAHTTWSDGNLSIEEMAAAAGERGYSYLTVTDHSRTAVYARGLEIDKLQEQALAIREFNLKGGPVRVLHGIESDILPDGSLDYPDEVLAELDFVIASIHSAFTYDEATMTARVLRAVRNPHVDILGHMTGRLLLRRDPFALDIDAVLQACADANTAVELNANPWRLDIDPCWHARCVELGIGIPICPDAHSAEGMADVHWGVLAARHGGLTREDVPNAFDADEFLGRIGRR
jgi:DNA polymerase (family 10)